MGRLYSCAGPWDACNFGVFVQKLSFHLANSTQRLLEWYQSTPPAKEDSALQWSISLQSSFVWFSENAPILGVSFNVLVTLLFLHFTVFSSPHLSSFGERESARAKWSLHFSKTLKKFAIHPRQFLSSFFFRVLGFKERTFSCAASSASPPTRC